ncbi:MAG: iron ABC transporter permease, partial [Pseudomonadales bacterium]
MSDSVIAAPDHKIQGRPGTVPILPLIVLCGVLLLPIGTIVFSVFSPSDGTIRHLMDTVLADYVVNSLALMLGVGVLVLMLAILPAWLVTMYRFPASTILEWALLLPLAMPAYIIAYTYTGLLDVSGPVQVFIRETFGLRYGEYWFPVIRSLGGAIAMLAFVLYPYVYLLTRTAFVEQSVGVLEVSRTLGCNARQAFVRVALPLARPAIPAGLALVIMETLSDYGTVQYFGIPVFTTGIFKTWFGLGSSVAAAQLSAILMSAILILLVLERWSRRQVSYQHTSSRYNRLRRTHLTGLKGVGALIYCSLPVVIGFLVPAGQLISWVTQTWQLTIDSAFLELVRNTIGLAATLSVVALLPALLAAYTTRQRQDLLSRSLVRLLGMGYAIPGTVVAVGVLIPLAFLDNTIDSIARARLDFSTGLIFSGTVFALLLAYLVRFLPVSLNTVDAGLARIKPTMDDTARSLGLRPFTVLRKVHMPVIRGSLLTACLLVFVDVMKELPATLVLRPFNFNTLAVRTYELANDERLA